MENSDHDAEIEHIPGSSNIIADPLSRLGMKEDSKPGLANAIAALREVSKDSHLLIREDINLFTHTHSYVNETEEEECLYPLRQNQFYPKAVREFQISPTVRDKIATAHNARIGHHSVERTVEKLIEAGHNWLYMREHVKYFIKRCCPYCQKMNMLKSPLHTNPFTTAAYHPFERQNWDTIGPLTMQDGSVVHILVAICCFCRWTELWLIDAVTAEETKIPVLQHFNRFGEPSQILTDNGTQFKNHVIKELMTMCGVENVQILAYSKEENAIVERMNKEVLRHLKAFVFELNLATKKHLQEMLPAVARIINGNTKAPNKTSPVQILFGNAIHLDRGLLLPKSAITDKSIKLSPWMSDMLKQQDKIMKKAELLQRTKDETHMANANPNHMDLPIGSWINVEYPSSIIRRGPDNKLLTFLRGPFKIKSKELDHYTFYNHVERKEEEVHASKVHPFIFDANFIDPSDIARCIYLHRRANLTACRRQTTSSGNAIQSSLGGLRCIKRFMA